MAGSLIDRPPSELLRFVLRLPNWLYRIRLGWVLGNRFLLLTHTGRKSGKLHHTVIEVVQHDKQNDAYYVVSGWGQKSDWYQNIQKNPNVTIHVGGRQFQAQATFISLVTAIGIMETYTREHPIAFKELSSLLLGKAMQPGSEAAKQLAEKMPMVSFHPLQSADRR